jgi:hypothetical protein
LSDPKLKPRRSDTGPLKALRPVKDTSTGSFAPWRTAPPQQGESVRWECVDGRWITIGLDTGKHAGMAVVRNSAGMCEYVDSYEAALALARKWRTI